MDYFIPIGVQAHIQNRAEAVRKKMCPKVSWKIFADCRGKFIYIRRYTNDGSWQNLGRLTYCGDLENMPLAIYKYRTEKYDPRVGLETAHHLDGTIEGAIKALLETC